jgi:hypothetical protein
MVNEPELPEVVAVADVAVTFESVTGPLTLQPTPFPFVSFDTVAVNVWLVFASIEAVAGEIATTAPLTPPLLLEPQPAAPRTVVSMTAMQTVKFLIARCPLAL